MTAIALANPSLDQEAQMVYDEYNAVKSKYDSIVNNTDTWLYAKASETATNEYSSFAKDSKYDFLPTLRVLYHFLRIQTAIH